MSYDSDMRSLKYVHNEQETSRYLRIDIDLISMPQSCELLWLTFLTVNLGFTALRISKIYNIFEVGNKIVEGDFPG